MTGGVIGGVITVFLMTALLQTVRQTARSVGSRQILEYGRPMRVLGVAMLLLGLLLLYAASCASAEARAAAWTACSLGAASGLWVFLEFFFVRIEFDDESIYTTSPWRRKRRIPWSDIVTCRYSNVNRWHVIKTRTHGTLRVSTYLSGIGSFLEKLGDAGRPDE